MSVEHLLSLDYLNIEDQSQLKSIIQTYKLNIDILLKELQQMGNLRDRNLAENTIIVQKMIKMEHENETKIKELQHAIEHAKKCHKQKIEQITEAHHDIIKNAQSKQVQSIQSLMDKISQLKSKQQILSEYQKQEQQFLLEIENRSQSLITGQYNHHDNMNKQEQKEANKNKQQETKNKELIKSLKRDVKMEAGRIVYEEKYLNEDKNLSLKTKLLALQQEVSKLRKYRNQNLKNRNEFKINTSLNEQEIEQYKAVGSIQKSKIKMYTDKVELTKKNITADLAKLELKIKEKRSRWDNDLKGCNTKYSHLEKEKEELKINLEKYRLLGQTILMQRGQVQQFFLMAIEKCKKEMSQTAIMFDSSQKQYGDKVDIDELLPKDKHRIITNLYTKLALAPTK